MEAETTRIARARFAVSAETFARLSYIALAALFLIVVSGATVRLTGSGLGCDNWPRCGSSFLPEKNFHALVEYGNRGVGFVVGLVTLAAAIGATRVERLPRSLLWAAWALPVTVLLQGVLGGITVLFELHPLIVMAHFLLSLLALAVAVMVALGAYDFARGTVKHPPLAANWLALVLVPSALVLVVTGTLVTAAGPHSGGEEIRRFGLLPDALHTHVGATAIFSIAFLGIVASLLWNRREAGGDLVFAAGVFGLLLVQMAVGDIQWREHLPWPLVLVHVSFATAIWVGVVALAARLVLRSRPVLP
ncbi:MAG TPA: COX15/CtaA family protein [Gaiellaceae bacterium]|jgi:cytochrome c oxidase assembly protein subunit 15|nr:COX15/CtaA family protein [Gaiellaceae bacterium]